ncbi:hypothetical protein [Fictibacillus fluitans]|uniref:Uncharacterized protein n=1 Tax=Fictibacillus fluitans TaxID=3058422 RepID=A0ABT8HX01_9BACL|nr:hypothetical protein [Fictibacillus sp. NE201]MDN4525314.1 hypothetical protein [Fictibacillus sp. NE201]
MAKEVGSNFNRDFRNTINENVAEQNQLKQSTEKNTLDQQELEGKQVEMESLLLEYLSTQKNIQTQVNNLVLSGDSSIEAAQARSRTERNRTVTNHDTLKARLDATDQDIFNLLERLERLERLSGGG